MSTQATQFDSLDMTCFAAATVAADVRQRIGLRLSAWGLTGLAGDVHVVATELIANACAATPRGRIGVRFCTETGSLLLAVWDASDELPRIQPVKELTLEDLDLCEEHFDDNGGRGLHLVQALAGDCGVRRTEPTGKWVWARFTL